MPIRFETGQGPAALQGVVIVVEPETGRATSVAPAPRRRLLILDGKVVAEKVLDDVRAGVARFRDTYRRRADAGRRARRRRSRRPKLYVANKKKAADTVGIASQDHLHPEGLEARGAARR